MSAVLFVDDEPALLRSLERGLRARRPAWQAHFAPGGEDALQVLARHDIDIVISDVSMPRMDGITLVQRVQVQYPHIARIVLSGDATSPDNGRVLGVVHQWLLKPCSTTRLLEVIDNVLAARSLVQDTELLPEVFRSAALPVSADSFAIASRADASDDELYAAFVNDPALAAKTMQLMSTSFFGQAASVTSIEAAITMIGASRLRKLAPTLVALNAQPRPSAGARASSEVRVARAVLPSRIAAPVATALLLCDLGTLIAPTHAHLRELDRSKLVAALLAAWGPSSEIVTAVAFDHDADHAQVGSTLLSGITLSTALVAEIEDCATSPAVDQAATALGLQPDEGRRIARELHAQQQG